MIYKLHGDILTYIVNKNKIPRLHTVKDVMTKFKLLVKLKKGYYSSIKCIQLLKKHLMERSENAESGKGNGTKKKIQARKTGGRSKTDLYSSQSEEGFIPLAARDSKWVDLAFYNPNFKTQQEDDECDEEELQVIDVDGILKPPILLLFPGLSVKDSSTLLSNLGSTSDVTKMLVGQKADFSRMKSSRKLLPTDNKLSSVPEMPQEETESFNPSILSPRSSGYSEPNEIQDTDEEVQRKCHIKKRKKLSDISIKTKKGNKDSDTSLALVKELRKRPYGKPKPRGNVTVLHKDSEIKQPQSNGSLSDDEAD